MEILKKLRNFEDFKKSYDHLDILINNAGIHAADHRMKDGIEYNIYVNCLGTFTLANLLVPLLEKSQGIARIVNLSSMGNSKIILYLQYLLY